MYLLSPVGEIHASNSQLLNSNTLCSATVHDIMFMVAGTTGNS